MVKLLEARVVMLCNLSQYDTDLCVITCMGDTAPDASLTGSNTIKQKTNWHWYGNFNANVVHVCDFKFEE